MLAGFQFRVGCKPVSEEARLLACNELELEDDTGEMVSINHFLIDLGGSGVIVRDRGSRRGTTVNRITIGGGTPRDVAPLDTGDNEVVAGRLAVPVQRRGRTGLGRRLDANN